MDDTEFDTALVAAAFTQAGLTGWRSFSVVEAAQIAGLPLARARARFPGPGAVLMRFGLMVDQAALAEPATEPRARERLFDLLMRRFDVLQAHRDGMVALLQALPLDPALSLALGAATLRSMGWMLEAAGIPATGIRGRLRANGLVGVWLYTVRAWKDDQSADLAGTMAALDKALDQAERFSSMLGLDTAVSATAASDDDVMEGVIDLPDEAQMPPLVPPCLPRRRTCHRPHRFDLPSPLPLVGAGGPEEKWLPDCDCDISTEAGQSHRRPPIARQHLHHPANHAHPRIPHRRRVAPIR